MLYCLPEINIIFILHNVKNKKKSKFIKSNEQSIKFCYRMKFNLVSMKKCKLMLSKH